MNRFTTLARTSAALITLAGFAPSTLAAPPSLLKDLNTTLTNDGSGPGFSAFPGLVALGDQLLFVADDGIHGRELWISDGTEPGTRIVKDIYPGPSSSTIASLTVAGGFAYFGALHPESGFELWRSDGTELGTRLIADVAPGTASNSPLNIVQLGSGVAFTTSTSSQGQELWVSDGTASGTRIVRDINPGTGSSFPNFITSAGDKVFFTAILSATGEEPWVTDGTEAGTIPLGDLNPGSAAPSISGFTTALVGGTSKAFFEAFDPALGNSRLWVSDGTSAGTIPVPASVGGFILQPSRMQTGPGFIIGEGSSAGGQTMLFRSDGTAAGTFFLANNYITFVFAGEKSVSRDGRVYFPSQSRDNFNDSGYEPWVSDGTALGTRRLRDLAPGVNGSYPVNFAATSTAVYFLASTTGANSNHQLHITDGTEPGTRLVATLTPGPYFVGSSNMVGVGSTLFFIADDGQRGVELWKSDGTQPGTVMVKDIRARRSSSTPVRFFGHGDRTYFAAAGGPAIGRELFATDGTESGTALILDINAGPSSSDPSFLGPLGEGPTDTLILRATTAAEGAEIWRTDGTPATTRLVKDINPGTAPSNSGATASGSIVQPTTIALGNLRLFTAANVAEGFELWRTDGTDAGTTPLIIRQGPNPAAPGGFARLNNLVLFTAYQSTATGNELWRTDGSTPGTALVTDFYSGASSSTPQFLTPLNGRILFSGATAATGRELCSTNGLGTGTSVVIDLAPGTTGSSPMHFTPLAGVMLFTADTPGRGREIWFTDGTSPGTFPLPEIGVGAAGGLITEVVAAGTFVFLSASTPEHGRELWAVSSDGASLRRITDIAPGPDSADVRNITRIGFNRVAFTAITADHGYELWESDGTGPGTRRIGDIAQGPTSSWPESLFFDGTRLLFAADDHSPTGRELYTWTPDPACACDLNGDNAATLQDLLDFLAAFFVNAPAADFNADGAASLEDLLVFLNCFFAACR